ncbi:MAG: hypothetical protein JWO06_1494 [Bacteroidota bacterium]|nr:hypothetical protein [Bacteroidota bacterium]
MMKTFFVTALIFSSVVAFAQKDTPEQRNFCVSLNKILESGRMENFESLRGSGKQSSLVPVPGYNISVERFPITYVDKDSRFVAKTGLNFDSLTAIKKLDEYKAFVNFCLDSVQWPWSETTGDDSTTVFFKELKEYRATQNMFTLTLAITQVGTKVYSINMYIRKNKRGREK